MINNKYFEGTKKEYLNAILDTLTLCEYKQYKNHFKESYELKIEPKRAIKMVFS